MHNPTAPPPTSGVAIEPFRIGVPEAVLIDLREHLEFFRPLRAAGQGVGRG